MELLSSISKKILKDPKAILVVGLLRAENNKLFNSMVFLNPNGNIIHQYDKKKLLMISRTVVLNIYKYQNAQNIFPCIFAVLFRLCFGRLHCPQRL